MKTLKKFIPFAKVDEAKREVWGIVTAEVADKDGETCDYAATKPHYKAWVDEFQKSTDGASFGNLREMHQLKAAGRGVGIEFRDEDKEIWMGFKVVDNDAWNKVVEKVYTGFSQGGEYVDGPDADGRYTASPTEVSLVDNPCLGVAHFAFIRASGAVEMVKIRTEALTKGEAKTKRVAGEDLAASAFAYVGDPGDTSTWKLPIKFSTDEKTKSHVRNALARFEQTQGIPDEDKAKVRAKIVAAAKEHAIEVSDKAALAALMTKAAVEMRKGMYEVGTFARLLNDLAWLQASAVFERESEGDESEVPEELLDQLKDLCETFLAMAGEEAKELTAQADKSRKGEKATMTELQKAAQELSKAAKSSLHAHMKKAMEHHEKCGKAMEECMKAMGHEDGQEPEMKDDAEKARKAGVAGGLTGAALDEFVRKSTGAAASVSAEDIGNIVESKFSEMLKALYGREDEKPAPKQTVIPITKGQDGLPADEIAKLRQEIADLKKGTHDPDGAVALMKADKGTLLTNDEAMRLGVIR